MRGAEREKSIREKTDVEREKDERWRVGIEISSTTLYFSLSLWLFFCQQWRQASLQSAAGVSQAINGTKA